jgi:membrane-bound serine protease (ClpP class)
MDASPTTAVLLLIAGLVVFGLELFVPSAGVLLVTAIVLIGASVYVAFKSSIVLGWSFVAIVGVLAPILPWLGLTLWKKSFMGRQMFLEGAGTGTVNSSARSSDLVGQIGRTLTPHRPAGITEISGRRIDTVAEGVMIERGQTVRVVAVSGNRIVVRKLKETESEEFSLS